MSVDAQLSDYVHNVYEQFELEFIQYMDLHNKKIFQKGSHISVFVATLGPP